MERLYRDYLQIWQARNNSMDTLFNHIKEYDIDIDYAFNITVKNTKEEKVPAFCCHLDTVHKEKPTPICVNGVIFDGSGAGVGGDDKCGIVACLELLKSVPCKCIFFTDEEKGGVGSRCYDQENLKDCKYLIEIDRKGNKDLIFTSGGAKLCSKEFQTAIKNHFIDFKEAFGTFTDVNVLDETNLNMMNISCGYYLPHTSSTYVKLEDLQNVITLLKSFAELNLDFKSYKRKETQLTNCGTNQEPLWVNYADGF